MTLNPFSWWRRRQARRLAEAGAMYRASVECLAVLMRTDAAKQQREKATVIELPPPRPPYAMTHSRRVH